MGQGDGVCRKKTLRGDTKIGGVGEGREETQYVA